VRYRQRNVQSCVVQLQRTTNEAQLKQHIRLGPTHNSNDDKRHKSTPRITLTVG